MTTILPSARSSWDVIADQLGQGLSQTLPQAAQQRSNRNALQQSLDEIKNLGNQPNATALDTLTSLMKAGAGIPGSERYMAQLYPLVMKQMEAKMAPQGAGNNASNVPQESAQSSNGMSTASQKNQSNLPIPLPQPAFQPYENELEGIELGRGPIPKTYTPEQYQEVDQRYKSSGLDSTPAIQQMQIQDEAARKQLEDQIKAAETVGNINDLRSQQQARVRAKLREHLPELNEADFAIAERIAQRPEFRNIKNDNLRAEKVRQEYNLYQSAVDSFNKNSERPAYDDSEHSRQMKNLGQYATVLVRNGQRDLADQILSNNKWGPVEKSKILNPLDEDTLKSFENGPKIPNEMDLIKVLPDDPRFEKEAENAIAQRKNFVKKYEDKIIKNFKTGSYDPSSNVIPGSSPLQMRDEFLKNGGDWREFEDLFNDAIKKGKIKLDSYQEQERSYLNQHPDKSFSIGEILWRMNPFYKGRK
ncbi:MAG TPA: hypothetical protein VFE71_01020 [Bacteroidales bacterium]|nr:hypothetical protein [Bacteroidales bacterium]